MKSQDKVIVDYIFSDRSVEDYDEKQAYMLGPQIENLTSHGIGGKMIEKYLCQKFGWEDKGGIHDYDFVINGREAEGKMETVNATKKLQCCGSFAPASNTSMCKSEKYKADRPYVVHSAVCHETGKVLWVFLIDTTLLSDDALFWERMSANAPRIQFNHYEGEEQAIEVLYCNKSLCQTYQHPPEKGSKMCISGSVWQFLEENGCVSPVCPNCGHRL